MEIIHTLSINNHLCRYQHLPNPGKPPLVFLMGTLQDIEHTYAFSSRFAPDFDYYVVELPGMGLTDPLPSKYPIAFVAQCLSDFSKKIIRQQFDLVAISYATGIAIEYAKRPDQMINKMALVSGMLEIPENFIEPLLDLMLKCKRDPHSFVDGFIDLLATDQHVIPNHEAIRRTARRKAKQNLKDGGYHHFVYNTLRLLGADAGDLSVIRTPTLVYTGEYDPFVTPAQCKKLADALPNSKFELLPGCDHLFALENPGGAVNMVKEFFGVKPHLRAVA